MARPIAEAPRRADRRRISSWWRGKLVRSAAIVGVMYARLPRLEDSSTRGRTTSSGTRCPAHLDDFQTWLLDRARRGATSRSSSRSSTASAIFARQPRRTGSTGCSIWLTWVGTTVAGVAARLALRRAARRGLGARRRSPRSPCSGLWDESMETLALMLAAVGLSLLVGIPLGHRRRPLRPLQPRDHAGARRDADRPRVRVPDAGRDPLLDRARRPRSSRR